MTRTGQSDPRVTAVGSGESCQDLIGVALAAPGALLRSTANSDLLGFAVLAASGTAARSTARGN